MQVKAKILYGYANEDGTWAIEPIFDEAYNFSRENPIAIVRVGDKWRFIDKKGNFVTTYLYDEIAVNFYNGIAVVKLDGKWGEVNEQGEFSETIK